MKKIAFIFVAVLLVLSACNKAPDKQEVADDQVEVDETEQDIDTESDANEEEDGTEHDEVDDEPNTDTEEGTHTNETNETTEKDSNKKTESTNGQANGWDKPDKIDNMKHLDIVHLAYDIFAAQDRKDYDFLESVAAKGTTIDRKNNKFYFENVTYPFEMEFFTKEELGTLELRYTHEEDEVVHVGFGAINYEEESSFVVEFEFIKEGSAWKLLSMDVNA